MKNLFEENTHFKLPTFVLALRLCVEIYRVLSQDELKLSIHTLISYVNTTILFPITITQLLELFEIHNR